MIKRKNRVLKLLNKDCFAYPCHKELKDCTFCYCPIYPCGIQKTGGKYIGNNDTWDCSDCNIIHSNDFILVIKEKFKQEVYSFLNNI